MHHKIQPKRIGFSAFIQFFICSRFSLFFSFSLAAENNKS